MKARTVVLGVAGLCAIAAVAAAVGFGGGDPDAAGGSSGAPNLSTAKVTRTTLAATETVDGSLGYGDANAVTARVSGTVTWLPAPGATVTRGQAVYAVDAVPVVLLYGSIPPYRTLSSGRTGGDVKQVEENLAALGYTGFTVDDEYTDATADAVRSWQAALGMSETGRVEPGRIVVAPGPVRVAEVKASLGAAAGGAVLTWTGTVRVVSIDLDVSKQRFVRAGLAVTVELPDGKRVDGKVTSVGTVATTRTTGTGSQAETTATVDVDVELADQAQLGGYDAAPVDVTIVTDRRENVLVAPVNALVALAGGGYGLQVVEGSTTRFVAVRTGLFAGGRVEVSGAGIAEGMLVGVPS